MSYTQVQEALSNGVEPSLICSTCPWDRFCIQPPSMTKAEVDKRLEDASLKDKAAVKKAEEEGKPMGMDGIVSSLLATMVFSGKENSSTVCPVLVVRMRSSNGRQIVDGVRQQMQQWDDSFVEQGAPS